MSQSHAIPTPDDSVHMRRPSADDGRAVHELIARCAPLDRNSMYCNLLQCTHFAETCVVAQEGERIVGFVSAYRVPRQQEALFVWQVAVAPEARNRGLGGRMLMDLLGRDGCTDVTYLKTTITELNEPSWSLFEAVARRLQAPLERQVLFDRHQHFGDTADSETLVTIGPLRKPA